MLFRLTTFAVILLVALSACGASSARVQDAQPLSDQVPTQTEKPVQVAPAVAPETEVVKFTIEGGIVGFCDELVVKANGDYTLTTCNQGQSTGTLPQSDRVSLKAWLENLSAFQLYTDDGAQTADGLATNLSFAGVGGTPADDPQKQVIFDWVSGLIVQLRPKPQPAATPTLVAAASPGALCPEIQRPALMLVDFENPTTLELLDVTTQSSCQVTLSPPPFGRVISAAGNFYYLVADSDTKSVTAWVLSATGEQKPLDFTTIVMEEPGPHGFTVSDDGSKIAWAQTVVNLEADPPVYKNYLWLANLDGSGLVTVLDGVENSELRFAFPVRFSTADNSLYYALQPDMGGPVFSGRFDNLYRVPAAGGEPELLYACPAADNPVCVTGLALDGSVFTTLDPATDSVQVMGSDGAVISSIPLPGTGYVERAAFNSTGSLAFISATLTEPASEEEIPMPNPGYITVLAAPYTGLPQTVLADNSVGTLWGWVNDNLLAFGSINAEGATSTSTVDLTGQVQEVSAKFAVGVWR